MNKYTVHRNTYRENVLDSDSVHEIPWKGCFDILLRETSNKVEPILDTLRFRTTKECELDMKKN